MEEQIKEVSRVLAVPYKWSYGQQLTQFFENTKKKVILGSYCPKCDAVMVPATTQCTKCFGKIESKPFPVSDHGRIDGYTIVYLPWPGQPTEPPYCMCTVILDGANTNMIHITGEVDFDKIHCEMRVQAVWSKKPKGDLYDILYFKPEVDPPPKLKVPGRKKTAVKKASKKVAKKAAKKVAKKAVKAATGKSAKAKASASKTKTAAKKTAGKAKKVAKKAKTAVAKSKTPAKVKSKARKTATAAKKTKAAAKKTAAKSVAKAKTGIKSKAGSKAKAKGKKK